MKDNKIIGLKRGTVVLKKYNKEWVNMFETEKRFLEDLLGDIAIDIQHIGSTAIPGLVAKPIIDMLMAIKSFDIFLKIKLSLENAEYKYRENGSDDKQILFVKGPEEFRTHYLHITKLGSSVWKNDIAFRDYLCTHPEAVHEYKNLKESLSLKYADDRKSYTAGKVTLLNQ